MSWEYQQGMYGETLLWYSNKMGNDIKKSCLLKCIDEESLSTNNLSQKDKLCSKNCLSSAISFYKTGEMVTAKWSAQHDRGEHLKKI